MRLLFVHERMGALGGAEANVLATADAIRQRGHVVGLVHGRGTNHGEAEWGEVFSQRFPVDPSSSTNDITHAIAEFEPDVVFLHKFSDSSVLDVLLAGDAPVVRMVHDHDLYCMRGYKYND